MASWRERREGGALVPISEVSREINRCFRSSHLGSFFFVMSVGYQALELRETLRLRRVAALRSERFERLGW